MILFSTGIVWVGLGLLAIRNLKASRTDSSVATLVWISSGGPESSCFVASSLVSLLGTFTSFSTSSTAAVGAAIAAAAAAAVSPGVVWVGLGLAAIRILKESRTASSEDFAAAAAAEDPMIEDPVNAEDLMVEDPVAPVDTEDLKVEDPAAAAEDPTAPVDAKI